VVDSADGRALCGQSPWSVWSSRVPADRLATVLRALRAMPPGVTPSEWRVDRTDPAGRAVTFEIVWPPGGHARVSAPALASAWGRSYDWHTLRSLLVTDIHAEGSDFVLSGRGAGHGVGLCEEGARSLARANWTMTAILGFYFPGARLAPAAPGPD
jgi:stage II sporulation protein D